MRTSAIDWTFADTLWQTQGGVRSLAFIFLVLSLAPSLLHSSSLYCFLAQLPRQWPSHSIMRTGMELSINQQEGSCTEESVLFAPTGWSQSSYQLTRDIQKPWKKCNILRCHSSLTKTQIPQAHMHIYVISTATHGKGVMEWLISGQLQGINVCLQTKLSLHIWKLKERNVRRAMIWGLPTVRHCTSKQFFENWELFSTINCREKIIVECAVKMPKLEYFSGG